jgi:soluble lytic murein transglycosylase
VELHRHESADSALALRPHIRDEREFYVHHLRRARLNVLCERYDRALELLRRLDGVASDELDPYKDLLLADVFLRTDRPAEAVVVARGRFESGYPLSLTPALETRIVDGLLASGRAAEALAFIDTLETRSERKTLLTGLLAREVEVRFELGDTLGAIRSAREFIDAHGTEKALAPVETAVARADPRQVDAAAGLDFAEVFVAGRRLSKAETLLGGLDDGALGKEETERKRLLRGEISYQRSRYGEAASGVKAAFADPALERRAKLLRARSYRGAGEKLRAAGAYDAFARSYPYDPKAPEALYVAWDLYREANSAKAAPTLGRIVETYPENKYARIATRRIAAEHVEKRRYTEAVRVLEEAVRRWGRGDEATLYYLAETYGKLGRELEERKLREEIAAVDSFSFYLDASVAREYALPAASTGAAAPGTEGADFAGFLECAAQRRAEARELVMREMAPWPPEGDIGDAGEYLARGLVFLEMGFRDWAETELRIFESRKGIPSRALVALSRVYDEYGAPSRAVRAVQRARDSLPATDRRRLERWFRVLAFPVPFPAAVMESCVRFGMSPHLVYAMMREESRFDERAVSGAGARGLMQLMPKTADELAGNLGFRDEPERDLFSPDFNITVGVFYASELLAEAKGDPLMMLAGYNAGFSNARRWFGRRAGATTAAERVDAIDYWETCDYVKKIVESARVYHGLYFSSREAANCK